MFRTSCNLFEMGDKKGRSRADVGQDHRLGCRRREAQRRGVPGARLRLPSPPAAAASWCSVQERTSWQQRAIPPAARLVPQEQVLARPEQHLPLRRRVRRAEAGEIHEQDSRVEPRGSDEIFPLRARRGPVVIHACVRECVCELLLSVGTCVNRARVGGAASSTWVVRAWWWRGKAGAPDPSQDTTPYTRHTSHTMTCESVQPSICQCDAAIRLTG